MKRSSTLAVAAAAALGTACGGTTLSSPLEREPDASKIVVDAAGPDPDPLDAGGGHPCPRERCPDSSAPPAPTEDAGVDSAAPGFDAADDTMGVYHAYGVPAPYDAAPSPPPPDDAAGEDAGEDVMGGGVDYGIPFPPDAGPNP
jgi:hypothetical protein